MKIFCFKGVSDSGKSRTIKKILNEVFNIILIPEKKKDFCMHLLYRGKRIGICSYGDDLNAIEQRLKPLKNKGRDIIICACRTRGIVYDFVYGQLGSNIETFVCERVTGKNNENRVLNERVSKFRRLFEEYLK